ncbi:MAG: LamG domain-containing protein [Opitutaceae bacterium]|nr:LamG domain-containing protein [Opitutaceae bacterium]
MPYLRLLPLLLLAALASAPARAGTVALWLFDEQEGLYPSSILNENGPHTYYLILGRGGQIVPGKFGRALRAAEPAPFNPVYQRAEEHAEFTNSSVYAFGLNVPPKPPGRTMEPMTWFNATFAAAFVNGDQHLRRTPFEHPTRGPLNLGGGDFTVEFWLQAAAGASGEGVVLEVGAGPRGENDVVTRLTYLPAEGAFRLVNQAAGADLRLRSDPAQLRAGWTHCAFVYDQARGEVRHYAGGRLQATVAARLRALPAGDEDYFSVGRDGRWERPLAGALDELRISDEPVYRADFAPPGSFSRRYGQPRPPVALVAGPPLQFPGGRPAGPVVELAGHKHLFIDDALLARQENVTFTAHPARIEETVLPYGTGWTTVIEDADGLIRLYGEGRNGVSVWTSRDGIHFDAPDLGGGRGNMVAPSPAKRGAVFLDPNGPPEERWKLLVGLHERGGFFVYTSPDGWTFRRNEVTALPFWAGSASTIYYDDQRQVYVAHHRADYGVTPGGKTERFFVRTEVKDVLDAWPFSPVTRARQEEVAKTRRIKNQIMDPWWLDNGPLSAGGFSIEYPISFAPDPALDPVATDIYNPRAIKYPWAPDTYVAFPLWFFHYPADGPQTRQVLARKDLELGTGLVETQLAVSRDGLTWKRYPRPAYVPVGRFKGFPMLRPYIAFGLVRRGDEIWQYVYTRSSYHDGFRKDGVDPDSPSAVVQRLSQRLDGFVSVDAPYEKEGGFTTHPLRFRGGRLMLNVDAGATGYVQVGFVDEQGRPVPGFGVDECVYINGNFVEHGVRWLSADGRVHDDISALAGRPVRLVFRMRGASLYAMQFVSR